MASLPALTPLVRLSQQIEGVLKIVGIDPRERLDPGVGWREAQQQGHGAPLPEEKCLGVLSASDVTSGLLETTHEAFEIILGTRQQRLFQGIKQMGSKRDRDLLKGGHDTQQCGRKTAVLSCLKQSQSLRLRFLTAGLDMSEMSDLVNPAEEHHELVVFRLE